MCVCCTLSYIYKVVTTISTSLIYNDANSGSISSSTALYLHIQIVKTTRACEAIQKGSIYKRHWSYCAYHTPEVWALNLRMPIHTTQKLYTVKTIFYVVYMDLTYPLVLCMSLKKASSLKSTSLTSTSRSSPQSFNLWRIVSNDKHTRKKNNHNA